MNCLNSILLEGACASEPEMIATAKGDICQFTVKSHRKDIDGTVEESTFDVEASGRIAQNIATTVKKGKGLRIVGRIKEEIFFNEAGCAISCTKIIAEHVEFKPGWGSL
ncbi:MAG: single-stranded DNA-binding protein [Spirochaetales bacterium]